MDTYGRPETERVDPELVRRHEELLLGLGAPDVRQEPTPAFWEPSIGTREDPFNEVVTEFFREQVEALVPEDGDGREVWGILRREQGYRAEAGWPGSATSAAESDEGARPNEMPEGGDEGGQPEGAKPEPTTSNRRK